MAQTDTGSEARHGPNMWRISGWGLALILLLLPLVAMQFGDEVDWTASDFVFAGTLFGLIGGGFELVVRQSVSRAYRGGAALALLGAFLLVWINGAVGIIGNESNDANLWFAAVVVTAVAGAVVARFRPAGLSLAMLAAAAVQVGIAVIALVTDVGTGEHSQWRQQLVGATAMFLCIWLTAAGLFRLASKSADSGSAI